MTETERQSEHVSIPASELAALRESHARLLGACRKVKELGTTGRAYEIMCEAVEQAERLVQR